MKVERSSDRRLRQVMASGDLLADPARAWKLSPDEAKSVLANAGALLAILQCRASVHEPSFQPATRENGKPRRGDRLMDIHQASEQLGMTVRQLYRRAGCLPFTTRVGRLLRFSERGIQNWITERLEQGLD